MAAGFRHSARQVGLKVIGVSHWDPQAPRYRAIARRVAQAKPDVVFLAAPLNGPSALFARALRAHLGREPVLIAPEFLPISRLIDMAGKRVASSMYISLPGLTNASLPAAGQRFRTSFSATQPGGRVPVPAVYAAQAADLLLDAIARSDGTRTSVAEELLAARVDRGLLGSFAFDHNGDITRHAITILRPRRGGGTSAVLGYEGAIVDRIITPATDLLG
jgi:branched-chain amino acid transport system substrate-binding protein